MSAARGQGDARAGRLGGRFIVFSSILSAAAVAVVAHYGFVMLSGQPPAARAESSATERGPILDRNGRILAMQTSLGNVTVWRPEVSDPAAFSRALAPLVGMEASAVEERVRSSPSDFIYLKKKVDKSTVTAVREAKAGNPAVLRGVGIEGVAGRVYPEKRLASHLVGFVGDDNAPLAGIEYAYDSFLDPGDGRPYGDQVILTIDANVQHIVEGIARKAREQNKAESVVMIALDPRSGDILGYASLPDFDPNDIRSSAEGERLDRPAVLAYEPGSVFKVFSLAAVMELGGMTDSSVFPCDGRYEKTLSSGERIVIKCLGAHGPVTAEDIIRVSCNSGAAYAADRVDSAAFEAKLRELGFGTRTGTGQPGETPGFMRSSDRWSARSKPTIAIGQEVAVSALQMVQAATAVANDGILVKPRVVSRVVTPDGASRREAGPAAGTRVLSAQTARLMRSYMAAAASSAGTGRRAGVEDLEIAVKTGTAQLIDPSTGAYSSTDFVASCLALVPADDPRLVVYTVISKPKGDSYLGGRIAAPPVREAAEALVDYLGIPRGRNQLAVHGGSVVVSSPEGVVLGESMPDLRGMPKRRLLSLLGREDLIVEIVGDGWVRRQEPEPGSPLEPGTRVRLELE